MIYIVLTDFNDDYFLGVKHKVYAQIKVFKKYFGRVFYTQLRGRMLYLMDGEQIIDKDITATKKDLYATICKWFDEYEIKRTYIRFPLFNMFFLDMLKEQKKKGIKSVLELPTYPYDGEVVHQRDRVRMEDRYCRERMYQYIDRISTYSKDNYIFNIPCINILNGVEVDMDMPLSRKRNKEIVMVAVSTMHYWHGYERIVEGLADYYQSNGTYKVILQLIGDGREREKYQNLVDKYNLKDKVEFVGKLNKEELKTIYANADIAVGSLGLYKSGISIISPIKGAEYYANGLPFICGYQDTRFSEHDEFIMRVPNNPEPININEVIDFYEKLSKKENYKQEMFEYAQKYLSWDVVMQPVCNYLL